MAVQTIAQLKAWFMTGLKPLQQQFWDWMDSYRHVSVPIQMSDLSTSLQALLNSLTPSTNEMLPAGIPSYNVQPGTLLEKIMFIDATNPAISVGTTFGGTQVYDQVQMTNGVLVLSGDMFFANGGIIYFNGVTEHTVVKVYKDTYAGNIVNTASSVTLAPGTASYPVAAGTLIDKILMTDATNPAISVGTSPGATDVYQPVQMAEGYTIFNGDAFFANAATLYFNGITANTVIKIFNA